jgi:hypothetical protein
MLKSLYWARKQSLSSRFFTLRVSCRRAVLLISSILWPFRFFVAAMEGRTLASVVAMSDEVSMRAVPAWPMETQTRSTLPQYRRSVVTRGLYFSYFFLELLVAADVPAEADLKDDKGAVHAFEGVDVRGRVGRHSSGVDDVGCSPRSGCHQAI